MKTPDEIRARLRGLLVQELDRRVEKATKRLPVRCTHNYRHPLDNRKQVDGETNEHYNRILPMAERSIGLCMLGSDDPDNWQGTICEDPIDAQRCPYFESQQTKKQLWEELQRQLLDSDWVAANMPDVAALAWALDEAYVLCIPWWKRLWFKLLRIRVEPVASFKEPSLLLPAPEAPDEDLRS